MRILRLLLVAMLVPAAFVLFVDVRPAHACSCAVLTDREAYDLADVVFTATLERVEDPSSGSSTAPRVFTFAVDSVRKGEAAPVQTVRSEQGGGSCGLEIAGAGPFLVFAASTVHESSDIELGRGELYAGLCGGTRVVAVGGPLDPAIDAPTRAPDPALVVEVPDDGGSTTDLVLRIVLFAVFVVAGVIGVRSVFFDRGVQPMVPGSLPSQPDRPDSDDPYNQGDA